jgi:hypothetical protein
VRFVGPIYARISSTRNRILSSDKSLLSPHQPRPRGCFLLHRSCLSHSIRGVCRLLQQCNNSEAFHPSSRIQRRCLCGARARIHGVRGARTRFRRVRGARIWFHRALPEHWRQRGQSRQRRCMIVGPWLNVWKDQGDMKVEVAMSKGDQHRKEDVV